MAECKVCGASVDEGQEYCAACAPSEGGTEEKAPEEGAAPAEGGEETAAPEEGAAEEGDKEDAGDDADEGTEEKTE